MAETAHPRARETANTGAAVCASCWHIDGTLGYLFAHAAILATEERTATGWPTLVTEWFTRLLVKRSRIVTIVQ